MRHPGDMHNQPQSVPGDTGGDADLAAVATLVGEPSRAKILQALVDGRALPASHLAAEAGLSRPAVSAHLAKLVDGEFITVEQDGRHRYYHLAGPDVANLVEALARIAPAAPIRSLRQGTRAQALRAGRTCYDHLAGRLGVRLTQSLIDRRALVPAEHDHDTAHPVGERASPTAPGCPYQLGPQATAALGALGVDLPQLRDAPSRRPLLRTCMDWSEQRPHVAGRLGAAISTALFDAGWITRRAQHRAVTLTAHGATSLHTQLGL